MSTGYRAYNQQLQLRHSPAEYVALRDEIRQTRQFMSKKRVQVMSRYLVSRCPYCGVERNVLLDTYSLEEWSQVSLGFGQAVGHTDYENERNTACKHLMAIQRFSNMEGTVPVETFDFATKLHLPFVMPFYFSDDVPSVAVIHSIPICRIEAADNGDVYNLYFNRFAKPQPEIILVENLKSRLGVAYTPLSNTTPETKERLTHAHFKRRYTAFFVAHYAEDKQRLRLQFVDNQLTQDAIQDPDFTMADVSSIASMTEISMKYPEGYDLAQWVAKDKLQWLDLYHPQLPLKSEPMDDFPYKHLYDITGERKPFRHRFGEIRSTDYL